MKKILFILLLLSGCTSPQPHFYQPVTAQNIEQTYPKVKSVILVKPISMPPLSVRPQITTIGKNDYELNIDEFNRWGASPDKLFQDILVRNLNAYLPNANIENQSAVGKKYQYAVSVEINRLIGKLNRNAELDAAYYIKGSDGTILKSGKLTESIALNEKGYDAYVLAQSHLFAALCAQIADDLNSL